MSSSHSLEQSHRPRAHCTQLFGDATPFLTSKSFWHFQNPLPQTPDEARRKNAPGEAAVQARQGRASTTAPRWAGHSYAGENDEAGVHEQKDLCRWALALYRDPFSTMRPLSLLVWGGYGAMKALAPHSGFTLFLALV